ncbi:MAG: hypothetical protein AAF708_02705 [Deinococcota bacterium]
MSEDHTHNTTSTTTKVNWKAISNSIISGIRNLWVMGSKRQLELRSKQGNPYIRVPFNILGVAILILLGTRLIWLAVVAALIAAFVLKIQFVILTSNSANTTTNSSTATAEPMPQADEPDASPPEANALHLFLVIRHSTSKFQFN